MAAKAKNKSKKEQDQAAEAVQPEQEQAPATDEVELSDSDEKVRQLSEENDKLRDKMLRAQAEFENYKRRRAMDIEQMTALANEGLIEDLIPVLDDFDLLIDHAHRTEGEKPLLDGAIKIREKLVDTLQRRGLMIVEAMGQLFDPELHEALMQQPSDEHTPGTIIAVHQTGYKLGEKLLRPARVIVAAETGGEA